ncbi:Fc.00g040970.m01.CDS01 [Cosmosporella sp. VM-42]
MLRPATPLSILLGVAFALLLLSVLSTPVIEAIPLGSFEGVTFGVFGFCKPKGGCSSIGIGYDTDSLFKDSSNAFDLPSGVRHTLSAILIVHPVAALLTLVMFVMAVVAHIHSASHSARYLLIVFIFTFITFLVCLLAFLIDVLLFVPHLAWGSYIVLAATILVALSGLVSCAMRRTLVSRKDRQKRIAENAEMSGENYYNREAQKTVAPEIIRQPTVPVVSGANGGNNDSLPTFASYEQNKGDQVSDERIPLTTRSPSNSNRSPNQVTNDMANAGEVVAFNNGPRRSGSRDQFGNPVNGARGGYGVRRGPSNERMNSRGRGDMGGYRGGRGGGYGRGGYDNYGAPLQGRGGYPPQPGRGAYGPRGGRGGYGPPPRGAYAAGGMRGGRSPPPGYNNSPGPYDRRPSPADAYGAYDQRPPDDPSNNYSSTNPSMPTVNGGYAAYTPDSADLPRAESPPPLPGTVPETIGGQAIEMDAAPNDPNRQYGGQYGQLRDSDVDVAGMVGLQQGQAPPGRHDTYMSEESKYSSDEQYEPPRAAWNHGSGRNSPRVPSPLHVQGHVQEHVQEQVQEQVQELPAGRNTPPVATAGGGTYYEDIDPRFVSNTPPGNRNLQPPPIEPIYEDIHANNPGARSPAESERSNFTSISQRGVNPRWNPNPPPVPYQQAPPSRRPVQQRQDMLLDNPDFQLPGSRANPQRGGPGMIPGSAYPTGPLR